MDFQAVIGPLIEAAQLSLEGTSDQKPTKQNKSPDSSYKAEKTPSVDCLDEENLVSLHEPPELGKSPSSV